MPTSNPMTLTYEEINSNTIKLNWKHRLVYDNINPSLSEKLIYGTVTIASYVNGFSFVESKTIVITTYYYKGEYILTGALPKTSTSLGRDFDYHDITVTFFTKFGTVQGGAKATIRIYTSLTPPSAPRNLTAQRIGDTGIQLGWLPPLTIGTSTLGNAVYVLNYQLEYSKNGGETWYSTLVPGNATTYTYSSLERNNQYIFRILAISGDSVSSYKSIGPRTTPTNPVFIPPTSSSDAILLFEKSLWGSIASPWKDYLTFAAEEWENHIKIQSSVIGAIRLNYPNFMGIKINISFINQPSSGGSVVTAYVPVNSIKGFNLNPTEPNYIKWNTYQFDLVINTHPDATAAIEASGVSAADGWRSILTHELGHGLGIGIVWQPEWVDALNKQRNIVVDSGGNKIIKSQLVPNSPRWQLAGTFLAPNDRTRLKPRFPIAQNAYNTLVGYINTQITSLRPRQLLPMMSNIVFSDFEKRAHWAYEINTNTAFTSTHKPIPNDIMSYGGIIGISHQQITPVSAGVLQDLGYASTASAPSISRYVQQVESNTTTGYSSRMGSIPESVIPKTYPGEEAISLNQILGNIELDGAGKIKNIVFNLDT